MNIHLKNNKTDSFKGGQTPFIRTLANESGVALIVALVLLVIIVAIVPAAMQLSTGDIDRSQSFKKDRDNFYLAEAGVEHGVSALKASELDIILAGPDGDPTTAADNGTVAGVGTTVTWNGNLYNEMNFGGGTYKFRVYDNNDGDGNLNTDADGLGFVESVGMSPDGTTKVMNVMLHKIKVPMPPGAVTTVGPTTEIEIESTTHTVSGATANGFGYAIDGTEDTTCAGKNGIAAESPGPVQIEVDVADADEGAEVPCTSQTCVKLEHDATGAEITGIGGGTVGNPDVVAGQTAFTAQDAADLHRQLTVIDTPDEVFNGNTTITNNQTFGTPTNPQVVYFDGQLTLDGSGSITGYGILIVDDEFEVEGAAALNWTGIILFGACATCTISEFEPTNSTIRGAIIAGGHEIEFEDNGIVQYSCDAVKIAYDIFDEAFKVVSWKEIL